MPKRTDLRHVLELENATESDDPVMNLYQAPGRPAEERRFKLYRTEPLSLPRVLPA